VQLIRSQRGSALMLIIVLMLAAASLAYISLDVLQSGMQTAMSEQTRIEAEALANDLIELTKYQLFYENVIYLDGQGPWNHSGNRGTAIQKLLASGMGSSTDADTDMLKACGGFDAKGKQIGVFKLNNIPVFCPFYLRSGLLNSTMLDQMVLQPQLGIGNLKQDKPGQYYIDIVYYDKTLGIDNISSNTNLFLQIQAGQTLVKDAARFLQRAAARIRIYSDDAGFNSATPERYLEVSSEVSLAGTNKMIALKRRQPLLTYPSTPRDFALFMMFPAQSDGKTPTKLWSEAMKITNDSVIDGRVFFNGNIDVPVANLPTFTETVIITGDFVPPLTKAQRQALPTKFLKGIVTNFSAPRFLFSGNCSATNPTVAIANGTGFTCQKADGTPETIYDYVTSFSDSCVTVPVSYSQGSITYDCSKASASNCSSTCVSSSATNPVAVIVSGPRLTVNLSGTFAYISSPATIVNNSAANVYGTILGGYFNSPSKVHIASLSEVAVGAPGAGSADTLSSYSNLFQSSGTGGGVSVPLSNLPIVYQEGVTK